MKRQIFLLLSVLSLSAPLSALDLMMLDPPVGAQSMSPRIASLEEQGAILSWLEPIDDGHRLMFATFDGERFGTSHSVAQGDFFANWADTPGMFVSSEGPWFAHWLQRSGAGPYAYDVRVASSLDRGATWSESWSPHDDGTLTEHGFVSYYPAAGDRVGLTWLDGRNTQPSSLDLEAGHEAHHGAGAMTLRTAWTVSDGRVAGEALLDERVCDCCATASAVTGQGPIVVYRDRSDTEIRDIHYVRRTPDGWTSPTPVHDDGWRIEGCPVNGPAVIARGAVVVVAWFTLGADGSPRVRVARSDDFGAQFGPPVTFDSGSAVGRVDLAWVGETYALTWLTEIDHRTVLRLARFADDGAHRDTHDLVPVDGSRTSGFPRITGLLEGRLLVTWTQPDPESGRARVRVGSVSITD